MDLKKIVFFPKTSFLVISCFNVTMLEQKKNPIGKFWFFPQKLHFLLLVVMVWLRWNKKNAIGFFCLLPQKLYLLWLVLTMWLCWNWNICNWIFFGFFPENLSFATCCEIMWLCMLKLKQMHLECFCFCPINFNSYGQFMIICEYVEF